MSLLMVAKATQTIPIVYAMSPDPVLLGLAASLGKPGGNSTGVTFLSDQLAAKRLETFREAAPRMSRVGVVRDPSHADNEMPVAQRAAQALKLELQTVEISQPADIDRALAAAKQANVDGLYIVSSRQTTTNVQRIVEFANRERLPLMGGWGGWVQAGGLMSYGPNVADMVRQASTYVDRVLKGVKPGDLPIQQPTRFELLVNLKNRQSARPEHSGLVSAAGRKGDRIDIALLLRRLLGGAAVLGHEIVHRRLHAALLVRDIGERERHLGCGQATQ